MQTAARSTDPTPVSRPDRAAARERLLQSGLRLFAQQGFARTSTRELAEAARVNVASISYYFGDKAGLYRAVFEQPAAHLGSARLDGLDLDQALRRLYADFLAPLRQGERARWCLQLHLREMLEPTGLRNDALAQDMQPLHAALLALLCRHFALGRPDRDVQRLAVCIAGLGIHLQVGHDVIARLSPDLDDGDDALDLWCERLVLYARSMIEAEAGRRAGAA